MKNERGITLVALIVTVIIMLILVGTAISVGTETYKVSQKEVFVQQMQLIQVKVDERVSETDLNELLNLGSPITNEQQNLLQEVKRLGEIVFSEVSAYYNNCRYFSKANLETYFGLENMEDDVVINFSTREVISMIGIEYGGQTYYTQYKLPGGQKLINGEATQRPIALSISKTMEGLNATVIISGISITNGTLSYKENGDTYWTTITNYTTLRYR